MKQKKTIKQEKQGETRRNPVINRSKPWETMRETMRNQQRSHEKPWEKLGETKRNQDKPRETRRKQERA